MNYYPDLDLENNDPIMLNLDVSLNIMKDKLEMEMHVYTIIKRIDIMEKLYNIGEIEEEVYSKQVSFDLSRYNNIIKTMDNFNLKNFMKVFSQLMPGI